MFSQSGLFNLTNIKQLFLFLFLLIHLTSYSQKISTPEKWWAVTHIFKAKKAFLLSKEVRIITQQILQDSILRGTGNGQQIDAFRHTYWMAILTQNIGAKRAYRLGKAHEKGNYRFYKKNRKEDGVIPDFISCKMDLFNNNIGIRIGNYYRGKVLKQTVIDAVINGKCKTILVDSNGNYLDAQNTIIPKEELLGSWCNKKVLVNSNYILQ